MNGPDILSDIRIGAEALPAHRCTHGTAGPGKHSPGHQLEFLTGLVFRVERGLLRQRERAPVAELLRHMFEVECDSPGITDASEFLDLLRDDIPVLNGVPADVL